MTSTVPATASNLSGHSSFPTQIAPIDLASMSVIDVTEQENDPSDEESERPSEEGEDNYPQDEEAEDYSEEDAGSESEEDMRKEEVEPTGWDIEV